MFISHEERRKRGDAYAKRYAAKIEAQLGWGTQGSVFATNRRSAIKIHDRESHYQRERDVYFRLHELDVSEVKGFTVPRLRDHDDELLVIEMTIVKPPFIVDFASAYLDVRPDHSPEVLAEWRDQKAEQFADFWPDVQVLLIAFEKYGIFLADVKPDNICVS